MRYVALSRARHSSHLYATRAEDADLAERHARGIPLPDETPDDPEHQLLTRLRRSAAKHLARDLRPDALAIAHLADTLPNPELEARARHAAEIEQTAPVEPPEQLAAVYERAATFIEHAAPARRVRALDRGQRRPPRHHQPRHGNGVRALRK